MFRMMLALAVFAGACGSAAAQDGGKIGWKGKGKDDDVKTIMADAKKAGKPMMMFFTSEG
jgi:ABC-type sugar transport system substrate-binding protein